MTIENDAISTTGFEVQVVEWLGCFSDTLCSFHLSTGRPPHYRLEVATKLTATDRIQADYISLLRLIHAVCYSILVNLVQKALMRWGSNKPADYVVDDTCGGPVIYPCYSLMDYADGKPVEKHSDGQHRNGRRRAWRSYG